MATVLRRIDPMASYLANAVNALKAQIGAGAHFHLDAYEKPVGSANATDLATSLVLANDIMATYLLHLGDSVTLAPAGVAHKAVDAPPALVRASDLATAITLANAVKADYNTHIASTTYHYNADGTNAVAAADATDQGTLDTLLNAIKTALNAHMADAPSAPSIRLVVA